VTKLPRMFYAKIMTKHVAYVCVCNRALTMLLLLLLYINGTEVELVHIRLEATKCSLISCTTPPNTDALIHWRVLKRDLCQTVRLLRAV